MVKKKKKNKPHGWQRCVLFIYNVKKSDTKQINKMNGPKRKKKNEKQEIKL